MRKPFTTLKIVHPSTYVPYPYPITYVPYILYHHLQTYFSHYNPPPTADVLHMCLGGLPPGTSPNTSVHHIQTYSLPPYFSSPLRRITVPHTSLHSTHRRITDRRNTDSITGGGIFCNCINLRTCQPRPAEPLCPCCLLPFASLYEAPAPRLSRCSTSAPKIHLQTERGIQTDKTDRQ